MCSRSTDARNACSTRRLAQWLLVPFLLVLPIARLSSQQAHGGTVPSAPVKGRAWPVEDLGMVFLPVPEGKGRIGSDAGLGDETPVQSVSLDYGMWAGETEVTLKAFSALMGRPPNGWPAMLALINTWKVSGGLADPTGWPAVAVSWKEANAFAEALCERERAAGRLPEGCVYRLPTEAEWEYVCRAGGLTELSCGDDLGLLHLSANYADAACVKAGLAPMSAVFGWRGDDESDGWAMIAPVKSLRPNAWGFFDMAGNAWEWCLDRYWVQHCEYPTSLRFADRGDGHVIKGGDFLSRPFSCRSAARAFHPDPWDGGEESSFVGFRLVLAPPAQPIPEDPSQRQVVPLPFMPTSKPPSGVWASTLKP